MMRFIVLFFITLTSSPSFALVDYTEEEPTVAPRQRPAPAPVNQAPKLERVAPKATSSTQGPSGMFNVGFGYNSISVKEGGRDAQVNMVSIDGHFQTDYNIYLDVAYWGASTDDRSINGSGTTEQGNPQFLIGFNWLRFGKTEEMALINILGGMRLKGNSKFASTRNDKIVGLETTKRFYAFALALGYRFHMSGTPHDAAEMDIGNIHQLSASIGWMVSPDIQFAIEGESYRISSKGEEGNTLQSELSFSYLSPKALLKITPIVGLEMGARFRANRIKSDQDIVLARLWDLHGSYGNSLFAGLDISI